MNNTIKTGQPFELGLYTFADHIADATTGQTISPRERMQNLLEEIELADQVGLAVFGLGEHHRPDYLVSATSTVLAAAAARTKDIRLSSAVTVLGSEDPIRVLQQYATLDLISGGRAEIMAGRGSFAESFPLFLGSKPFGHDDIFAEKLGLLLSARTEGEVTWEGRYRPELVRQRVYPRPIQEKLPVWLAVGGTPASAVRAGELGLPMALAIIGGAPERYKGVVDLYREAARSAGNLGEARLGINSIGFVADTSQAASDLYFPHHAAMMNRIGRERGWPHLTRDAFDKNRQAAGPFFVGDPEQVAEKIVSQHRLFGHQRFLMQTVGTPPHAQLLRSIELLGTKVAPLVRKELGQLATPS